MARAVNQTIAWVVALFLSLIVFGVGLAIVFSLKPKRGDDHGGHDEHAAADEHETHDAHSEGGHDEHKAPEHGESAAPEHPADAEASHAKPKVEHEDPHAKEGGEDEKEITPASIKAKTEEHTPEAKPHH